MFQSSSTASGSLFWHALSASSPSSASEISNSSPSRMRRATLRITLESSTTRQVFIALRPLLSGRARIDPILAAPYGFLPRGLRRDRLAAAVEDAVDVEHHQQLLLQPMHPGRHPREMRVEIDRHRLARVVGELEHLADRV